MSLLEKDSVSETRGSATDVQLVARLDLPGYPGWENEDVARSVAGAWKVKVKVKVKVEVMVFLPEAERFGLLKASFFGMYCIASLQRRLEIAKSFSC
jgi:hypothetical protein